MPGSMSMETGFDLYDATKGEDDLGVVIRSHIIIEKSLNLFVESLMSDKKEFRKLNLGFEKTVKLAVALGLNERFRNPLCSLGRLRNQFAHTIRSEISAQDANNLYKSFRGEDKEILHEALAKTRKKLSGRGIDEYKKLPPKLKYIFNVVVLNAGLEVACRQIPNQKSQSDA